MWNNDNNGRMIRANFIKLGVINPPTRNWDRFRYCPERYVNGDYLPTLSAEELARRGFHVAAAAKITRDLGNGVARFYNTGYDR